MDCLLAAIIRDGFTLARGLELHRQWSCILGSGPIACLNWVALVRGSQNGILEFRVQVGDAIECITDFVKKVVISRKDFAIRKWRNWILEDPLVHPYRWLRSDLVPPAPFLACDPGVTTGGSGILVEPHAIDEQFRRAWLPFFCRGGRGAADLDAFRAVAEDLIPLLPEVRLPPLTGDMLYGGASQILEDCGHAPFVENPKVFDQLLANFADDVEACMIAVPAEQDFAMAS